MYMSIFKKNKIKDSENAESRLVGDLARRNNSNNGFYVPGDLDDNISNGFYKAGSLDDSTTDKNMELIQLLYDKSMEEDRVIRDMNAVKNYLQYRQYSNNGFMYAYDDAWLNNTVLNGPKVLEQTPNGDGGAMISGEEKPLSSEERKYRSIFDYRITIRNSDKITTDEAIAFVNSLIKESKERKLTLRAKNYWETDAFILYCDQDNLYGTVEMLNDLAHNQKYGELVNRATKHFGDIQPFAGYLEGAYYGIAFAHPEGEYGKVSITTGSFGNAGMGGTFNGYMDFVLDSVYSALLEKYGGDTNKISVDEMYDGIRKYHSVYMFGNVDMDCPLFMNRRNYNELLENNKQVHLKR